MRDREEEGREEVVPKDLDVVSDEVDDWIGKAAVDNGTRKAEESGGEVAMIGVSEELGSKGKAKESESRVDGESLNINTEALYDDLFPPFAPLNTEEINQLPTETSLQRAIKDEATLLHDSADQAIAKTEADYILRPYLSGDDLSTSPLVEQFLPRRRKEPAPDANSPPSSPSSADPPFSSSPSLRSVRLGVSQDSDLLVSLDQFSADFLISHYFSKGVLYFRVTDMKGLAAALGWSNRWIAAALAGLVGNDFVGIGIEGFGYITLADRKDKKVHDLWEYLIKPCQEWIKIRRLFIEEDPSTLTLPLLYGSHQASSLDEMEDDFDECLSRFYKNKKDHVERLKFATWANSVEIQAGDGGREAPISRKSIQHTAEVEVKEKVTRARKRTKGFRKAKKKVLKDAMDLEVGVEVEAEDEAELETSNGNEAMEVDVVEVPFEEEEASSSSPSNQEKRLRQPRNHPISFPRPPSTGTLKFDKLRPLPESSTTNKRIPLNCRRRPGPNGPQFFELLENERLGYEEKLSMNGPKLDGGDSDSDDDSTVPAKKSKLATSPDGDSSEAIVARKGKKGRRGGRGKGKGKEKMAEEDGVESEESDAVVVEEKESKGNGKKKVFHFPSNGGSPFKSAPRPFSLGIFRQWEGHEDAPEAVLNIFSWLRQIWIGEAPAKLEILNRTLFYYSIFSFDSYRSIINGGQKFMSWAAAQSIRIEWLNQYLREHAAVAGGLDVASRESVVVAFDEVLNGLSVDRRKDMIDLVIDLRLNNNELDPLCDLAVITYLRAGGLVPLLNHEHFLSRNFTNLSNSFSNAARSHCLYLDFIFSSLITQQCVLFVGDYRTTPFRIENESILNALDQLNDDGLELLTRTSKCTPAQRRIREFLTNVRIGRIDPGNDDFPDLLLQLAQQLRSILTTLALTITMDYDSPVILTTAVPTIVASVVAFLLAEIEWVVENWRAGWRQGGKAVEEVTTMGEWIIAAGGEERVVYDERWIRNKRGKKGGKSGKNGMGQDKKDVNHDAEVSDEKNGALVALKIFTAQFANFRRRPLRWSPTTASLNPELLQSFLLDSSMLSLKIRLDIRRKEVATLRLNASLATTSKPSPFDSTPFPPVESQSTSQKIAQQRINSYRIRDQTLQRQASHPEKIVHASTNEWRGIPFPKDSSGGHHLVQPLVPAVTSYIEKTVKTAQRFLHSFGLSKWQEFQHGAYFVAEMIFKPTFGQWLLNGDITISFNRIILGCVDYRFRPRSMVEKFAKRNVSARDLILEELNSDNRILPIVTKLSKHLGSKQQLLTRKVRISEEDREEMFESKQLANEQRKKEWQAKSEEDKEKAIEEEKETKRLLSAEWEEYWKHSVDDHEAEPPQNESRQRRRGVPKFQQVEEWKPFVSRFVLNKGKTRLEWSPRSDKSSPLAPPPSNAPISPIERRPPHLLVSRLREESNSLDRPVRARDAVLASLEKAKSDPASNPAWVVHDTGQHEADVIGVISLTESISERHFISGRQFLKRQIEDGQVARELAKVDTSSRTMQVSQTSSQPSPTTRGELYQRPLPALPSPSSSSTHSTPPLVPPYFSHELSSLPSPLLSIANARQDHLGALRSREVADHRLQKQQRFSSNEMKVSFRKPIGWTPDSQKQSILNVVPAGATPLAGGFGTSVAGLVVGSTSNALKSLPWLEVTTISCGEGFTSSVCIDPRCRSSLLSPCFLTSPEASVMNRIKYCIWELLMGHRDGLATSNIASLVYLNAFDFDENPLSPEFGDKVGRTRQLPSNTASAKLSRGLHRVLEDQEEEETKGMLEKLSKSDSMDSAKRLVRKWLEEKKKGSGSALEEEEDGDGQVQVEEKRERRKGKRGGRSRKGRSKDYDDEDPIAEEE
ncbi:hypothetical protein JCM5353_006810 [Sporobolomyces roseus]